jgi:hypothetical protein
MNLTPGMTADTCTWCGNRVDAGDGYRLAEPQGDRGAVFCRLEHVVPWAIQGAHWEAGESVARVTAETAGSCSSCGRPVADAPLVLVRHRAEHRVADRFCSVDHLLEWAKAGGRWRA